MKLILIAILNLFFLGNVSAQSHNLAPYSTCRYAKKMKGSSEGGSGCPACQKSEEQEKEARKAEDKRRTDAIVAQKQAENEARQKAFAEKQKLKQAEENNRKIEENNRKIKEAANKIENEANIKKYTEIANKGKINPDEKGPLNSSQISLLDITPFKDDVRKKYGFKIENTEVLSFPFESDFTGIGRIEKTNYFVLTFNKIENYRTVLFYNKIIDHLGNELSLKGVNKFEGIYLNSEKTLVYINLMGSKEYITTYFQISKGGSLLYDNRESAIARIEMEQKVVPEGYVGYGAVDRHIKSYTMFTANLNLQVIKEQKVFEVTSRLFSSSNKDNE